MKELVEMERAIPLSVDAGHLEGRRHMAEMIPRGDGAKSVLRTIIAVVEMLGSLHIVSGGIHSDKIHSHCRGDV